MSRIRTLLFCGGPIHHWRSVGDEMATVLRRSDRIALDRVDDDLAVFAHPEALDGYDAIALYYTRGELTDAQTDGLLGWTARGGGFVGIHGATASFRESPRFHAFIGGLFIGHPALRRFPVSVLDPAHPITRDIGGPDGEFFVADEQYMHDYDPRVAILATGIYKGRTWPVIWTKPWGEGRVAYLALGHDGEAARAEPFGTLLERCVAWSAGQL